MAFGAPLGPLGSNQRLQVQNAINDDVPRDGDAPLLLLLMRAGP